MKFSRRAFLKAAGAVVASTVLPACGPKGGSKKPKGAVKKEDVTLTMQPGYFLAEGREPLTEDFRETFDSAGLDWIDWERDNVSGTALDARMAAGDAPDILYVYPALTLPWAHRDQVVNLQPEIDADAEWKKDLEAFLPGFMDGYRYKGDLYAGVYGAEAACVVYNPAHLKRWASRPPLRWGWTVSPWTSMQR